MLVIAVALVGWLVLPFPFAVVIGRAFRDGASSDTVAGPAD